MNALELWRSAMEALGLLAAAPGSFLLATAVYLAVAEGLMLVPRIGFLLKYCVASLLAAQMLVLCRVVALGETPQLRILADAIYLPPSSMLVLMACALLPFFIGLSYFAVARRADGLRFFFGNVFRHKLPDARHFLVFKLITHISALPLTFVAPAMVLKGHIGGNALEQGLVAGMLYWQALLALLTPCVLLEIAVASLPRKQKPLITLALLLAILPLLFAYTYTLAVRAFGL